MVSSESVPFSKSGGLADVVGALSGSLVALGEDVRVILPLYGSVDSTGFTALDLTLEVELLNSTEEITVLETTLDGAIYYFLDHPLYSGRIGIYGDTSHAPYGDNLVRYMLLNKGAMALVEALDWKVDVMHCHDWTVGFLPYLIKTSSKEFFAETRTLMTIHNLAYQGEFSRLELLGANIEPDEKFFSGPIPYKRVNMLKAGLEYADHISTVSPTYAKEIQDPAFSCGLEELLQRRSEDIVGIINGIDYTEWNPEIDPFIVEHFNAEDQGGKAAVKAALQKRVGLPVDPSVPLFSMISRLASQKGFVELLAGSPSPLEQMLQQHPMQMVIVGTGDAELENGLRELGDRYENLSVQILFSNELAHQVEAGSDFFLMPSRYEPCGLNQLYSLRYGTIPVARRTGGLADSIIDLDAHPETGTGILFDQLTEHGILESVARAIGWWQRGTAEIEKIRRRGMLWDSSWQHSAQRYQTLYQTSRRSK